MLRSARHPVAQVLNHHSTTDAFTFRKGTTITHPSKVYNVVPGDMTYDGKLDLLVMSEGTNNDISMTVYLGPFDSASRT